MKWCKDDGPEGATMHGVAAGLVALLSIQDSAKDLIISLRPLPVLWNLITRGTTAARDGALTILTNLLILPGNAKVPEPNVDFRRMLFKLLLAQSDWSPLVVALTLSDEMPLCGGKTVSLSAASLLHSLLGPSLPTEAQGGLPIDKVQQEKGFDLFLASGGLKAMLKLVSSLEVLPDIRNAALAILWNIMSKGSIEVHDSFVALGGVASAVEAMQDPVLPLAGRGNAAGCLKMIMTPSKERSVILANCQRAHDLKEIKVEPEAYDTLRPIQAFTRALGDHLGNQGAWGGMGGGTQGFTSGEMTPLEAAASRTQTPNEQERISQISDNFGFAPPGTANNLLAASGRLTAQGLFGGSRKIARLNTGQALAGGRPDTTSLFPRLPGCPSNNDIDSWKIYFEDAKKANEAFDTLRRGGLGGEHSFGSAVSEGEDGVKPEGGGGGGEGLLVMENSEVDALIMQMDATAGFNMEEGMDELLLDDALKRYTLHRANLVANAGAIPLLIEMSAPPEGPMPDKENEPESRPSTGKKKKKKGKGKKAPMLPGQNEAQIHALSCLRVFALFEEYKHEMMQYGIIRHIAGHIMNKSDKQRWNTRNILLALAQTPKNRKIMELYEVPNFITNNNVPVSTLMASTAPSSLYSSLHPLAQAAHTIRESTFRR